MDILSQNTIDLVKTQQDVIIQILDNKYKQGIIKSEVEYQQELMKLSARLTEKEPIFEVRVQEGVTDADNYNENFVDIYIDTCTVFNQINQIDNAINKHQSLNQSTTNNLSLRIKAIGDEISRLESLIDSQETSDMFIETFQNNNGIEKDQSYYINDHKVKLDTNREAITLSCLESNNLLISKSGKSLAKIKIIKQLGGGLLRARNPEHNLNKAIDSSPDTFWAEDILTDSPIKVPLNSEFYNIQHGAVCAIEIEFDYINTFNEISLVPFCEYPMEVVAIKSYKSNLDTEGYEIVSPYKTDPELRNQESTNTIIYQFPDVTAKRIQVILNQQHYVRTQITTSIQESSLTELMFNTSSKEDTDIKMDKDIIFKPTYHDKIEIDPNWALYLNSIQGIDSDLDTFINSKEQNKTISKYQYTYGLYDISIRNNKYQNTGVYYSSVISTNNIKTVAVKATEIHPKLPVTGDIVTSIEYYISHIVNSTTNVWHNILPLGSETIMNERLFPTINNRGEYQAIPRFNMCSVINVKSNGSLLYAYTDYTLTDTGVLFKKNNNSAIYTLDYKTDTDAHIVDFVKLKSINVGTPFEEIIPNVTSQEYLGTDKKGKIKLDYFTYVNRDKLNSLPINHNLSYTLGEYVPVTVKIIDNNGYQILQSSSKDAINLKDSDGNYIPYTYNTTDYYGTGSGVLQSFDPKLQVYAYQVKENYIQFNISIPKTWMIIVDYHYLVGKLRTKIVLRNNLKSFSSLTPIVKNYGLMFQTLS